MAYTAAVALMRERSQIYSDLGEAFRSLETIDRHEGKIDAAHAAALQGLSYRGQAESLLEEADRLERVGDHEPARQPSRF